MPLKWSSESFGGFLPTNVHEQVFNEFWSILPLECLKIDSYGCRPLCKLENILRALRQNKRCNSLGKI